MLVGVWVGGSAVDVSVMLMGRSARTDPVGKTERDATMNNIPPAIIGRTRQMVCLMVI